MNQLTLSQVVNQLGGGQHVTAFFLVLARVGPLFVFAPMFSSRTIPIRVRGIVAVGLAIGLTGVAVRGQSVPSDPLAVTGVLVQNMLVGFGFAFAIGLVFSAVQAAGTLTDAVSGFSFGAQIDPINGNQGGAFTQLYGLVGVALFLAIGGDAWTLRGLSRTFNLVPLVRAPRLSGLVSGAEQIFGALFTSAIEVAAPVMLAMLITDVAFGMVSKVVPQVNLFGIGFPLKIGVALLVVSASIPFLGGWMSDQLASSVGTALRALPVH
jgi:flagellar biosynthetic protein FliR